MSEAFTIHQGDALTILRTLPDRFAQCCVTSPPYWGLRDYGTATWMGGDPECDHLMIRGTQGATGQRADRTHTQRVPYKDKCGRCGAERKDEQIGLESTPDEFITRIVKVFREVRRVLRDDGTLWMNLGDSYANDGKWGGETGGKQAYLDDNNRKRVGREKRHTGLKPKDLIGIPWRVAFSLQADGWYLRQDIIWHKPNPMPESVRDRCTKAHEYLFLLAKSEKYYYDWHAIKEPASPNSYARYARGRSDHHKYADGGPGRQTIVKSYGHMRNRAPAGGHQDLVEFRNRRSVWTIATEPCRDPHFATFPLKLAETCILAGAPEGGLVVDPFSGAGTTGLACLRHGRNYTGIELNPESVALSYERARRNYPLLLQVDEVTA